MQEKGERDQENTTHAPSGAAGAVPAAQVGNNWALTYYRSRCSGGGGARYRERACETHEREVRTDEASRLELTPIQSVQFSTEEREDPV